MTFLCTTSLAASTTELESQEVAVQLAEQYIRSNSYDTERKCPESLARLDAVGAFNMQPHCRHYRASEATVFAVLDEEILWRVFFRKAPPRYEEGRESFRVVEVFRTASESAARVALKDIELFLPENATLLGCSQPPISAKGLPPNGYMGIELLKSTEQNLFCQILACSKDDILWRRLGGQ
jgi:hypothetical protein